MQAGSFKRRLTDPWLTHFKCSLTLFSRSLSTLASAQASLLHSVKLDEDAKDLRREEVILSPHWLMVQTVAADHRWEEITNTIDGNMMPKRRVGTTNFQKQYQPILTNIGSKLISIRRQSGSEWRHPNRNTPSLLTDRRTGGVPTRCFCQDGSASNCSAHPSCLRSTASANRRLNCWTDLQFNSFQSSDADKADHRLITGLRCDSLVPPEHQQDLRRRQNLWGSAQQIRQNRQEAAGENAELLPHWLHKILY